MKKLPISVLLFLTLSQLYSQSNWELFRKESNPIKVWVLMHPFKVKKAYKISLEATRVSDSIAKTDLLDQDSSGGQVDAFRHAYWMATLRQEIGKCATRSLGKVHERDNYKTFKKRQLEDGILPDKASKEMDLFNNNVGLKITNKRNASSKKTLIDIITSKIHQGNLKIIKKDTLGNYLSCNGNVILVEEIRHTWENGKCVIPSNK